MKKTNLMALGLLALFFCVCAHAEEWGTEATLNVAKPGLIEAALLPQLHRALDDGLDLKVIGPDGKSRSFELYWRDDNSALSIRLAEKSARLEDNIFIWETLIPPRDRILVKSIKIHVLSNNYIGSVDIYGLKDGAWIPLAAKSALYASQGVTRGDISIREDVYEGFRLHFTAVAKKPVPIGDVLAQGIKTGKDYLEFSIPLQYARTDEKDALQKPITRLLAQLPGSGLYLHEIELSTTAQFNGLWTLERQDIVDGRKTWIPEIKGKVTGVDKGKAVLKIKVDGIWQQPQFNLRLAGSDETLSVIQQLAVKIRVPRLVFLADTAGVYVVRTGFNSKAAIRDVPSADRLDAPVVLQLDAPRTNRQPLDKNPASQFALGGAPFKADGYAWRSGIQLSGPGYYRLILHRQASLEDSLKSLRIVRNGAQYPYFIEQGVVKDFDLKLQEDYDSATNTSTWHLELPQASAHWENLILTAGGIFHRNVIIERDLPKPMQGKSWRTLTWSNASLSSTELVISLNGFPKEETKIRLIIPHGDNKALKLEKARVTYLAPALHFLADAADGYELYGSNPAATAPAYDVHLIQDQLSKQEPREAVLFPPQKINESLLKNSLVDFFSNSNWGLYAVLGLLSLVLMILIVVVFPKPKNKDELEK